MEIIELEPWDERLVALFPVMQELRDHLDEPEFNRLYEQAHPEGFRIVGVFEGSECRAAAGYHWYTNLYRGKQLYIDDLVTAQASRSKGYGKALNDFLCGKARDAGCSTIQLDSNVQRKDAHHFYFREGYTIRSFHFERDLNE